MPFLIPDSYTMSNQAHLYLGVANPSQPLKCLSILSRGIDQQEFSCAGDKGAHPDGKVSILWSNNGTTCGSQREVQGMWDITLYKLCRL